MKSLFRFVFISFSAAFLLSSCAKKNELGKMIPKNAMFVAHLDVKSLRAKLSWDEIKQTSWYQKISGDSTINTWQKKLLDNPENSGIDLNSSVVFFVAKDAGTEGEIILEGSVKSASDFEQFNKNLDSTATEKKDGDLNVLVLKNESVVTWNDTHFVYAFDAGSARSKLPSMPGLANQGNMSTLVDKSVSLAAYSKKLFSLQSDSSLEKNEKFANLIKEAGDIHAWINTEEIVNGSGGLGMLGMLKLDVFFKDNISTYTVNFDNGKIDITQKGYAGKDFSDFLQKYSGGSLNTDMIKTVPSQNVFGAMALNFKPEAIKELIKLTGMDGMLNNYSSQIGFNLDDFVKANKGDLLVAVTDLKMKKDSVSYNDGGESRYTAFTKPDMNFLFSVSIGDKPSFQKILDAGKKISGQMGVNDTSIAYGQNDKLFAVSNKQHFLNDYLAGNANNKFDFLDKMSGQPVGAFIDIHKILTVVSEEIKSNDDTTIMNESLKLWNNIYMKAGQFKDGAITGNTEINFIDQNTNSLKLLNHYFDVIAKTEMAKEEKEKTGMAPAIDSTMMAPMIDSAVQK
jgi:hypothetical protein